MHRFYLPQTSLYSELIISQKDLCHQLTRVLRLRVGDQVIFFDGVNPRDFIYEIQEIGKKSLKCHKKEEMTKDGELAYSLHLFQALPHKLEKLEYIIGKGVEVGYRSFMFFPSERSQKNILSDSKKLRLQKIAIEAVEQCGGNNIPEIVFLEENIIFNSHADKDIKYIFCHTSRAGVQKLSDIALNSQVQVGLYVGPEGGFTDREVQMMQEIGYVGVNFGNRILRCETVSSVVGFYLSQKKED